MKASLFGGILLIVGTSIGGGMLALPMITASFGFAHSALLFIAIWLIMTFCAFLILEVNLALPRNSNLISMAKITLGRGGALATWTIYLLLLYALLSAYLSGGGDLLHSLLQPIIKLSNVQSTILFACFFSLFVYQGVRAVDWINRGLMLIKLISFLLLVLFISPHIQWENYHRGHWILVEAGLAASATSFGYAIIIPTLRDFFDGDIKQLRRVILFGSCIPLICYIIWIAVIQGSIPTHGPNGLMQMASTPHSVGRLTQALTQVANSILISQAAHVFTSVCITTSFLGVALCCIDFLSDGLQLKKKGGKKIGLFILTLAPPLLVALNIPQAFVLALSYAGLWCVLLLILLPITMAYRMRYHSNYYMPYQVFGGKPMLIGGFVYATIMLIIIMLYLISH